jgi:hypothetical protein
MSNKLEGYQALRFQNFGACYRGRGPGGLAGLATAAVTSENQIPRMNWLVLGYFMDIF